MRNNARLLANGGKKMFGKKNEQKPDLEMYVIYDTKVGSYENPFFGQNKEGLMREILNHMRKDASDPNCQNKYYLNAEDFQVFKIGSYFRSSGEITPQAPEHLINMHELKALAKPEPTRAL